MAERLSSYTELADLLENLPLLVREARRARHLNLRDAATQSGVNFNTLSRVERGMECSVPNAIRLLRWLDSRPSETGTPTTTEEPAP